MLREYFNVWKFILLNFRENCSEKMDEFLKRCFYHSGQYDSQDNFAALDKKLKEHEVIGESDFYSESMPPAREHYFKLCRSSFMVHASDCTLFIHINEKVIVMLQL